MFGFGESKDAYEQIDSMDAHHPSFSHELIAGAAGFAAMKAFEDRQRSSGEPVSHGAAKEILAGLAAAEADRLAETKGLNMVDRERAKHQAKKQAHELYDQHYGGRENYDPNESTLQY